MRRETPRTTVLCVVLTLALAGCAGSQRSQPSAEQLESRATEEGSEYVIGATDLLRISVWRQPDLSMESVPVRLDGKISLPLLDDVQAAGLTPTELKAVITERLEEYIGAPTVTVIVRQINSKVVYVLGEVRRQGPLQIRGDFRVVDAIAAAGGFGTFAGKNDVKVIRNDNGHGPVEFRFDYEQFVNGHDIAQNILLLPGDKIVVPEESPFWR
jgi:polysaccharide export outer membrane protein